MTDNGKQIFLIRNEELGIRNCEDTSNVPYRGLTRLS